MSTNAELGASAAPGRAVAVTGMACRLPGASGPEALWELVRSGRSAVSTVPPARWDTDALYDSRPGTTGRLCSRAGGFLEDLDRFDAEFFGITPREVERMDPQQRLVLEVAWEALEDAALVPAALAGSRTGVFIGASGSDFGRMLLDDPAEVDIYSLIGGGTSMLANRLSVSLDLRGPSVVLDTACSSSLVAVHQAMRSLRDGECDLAIAGGVNLCLSPEPSIANSHAGLLSPAGASRVFDQAADGFARGEGCALVVLRRDDGTGPVHARLLGSALTASGRGNGLGAPNGAAQEEVIRLAQRDAGVAPADVGFVETHATGTPIGDAVEAGALSRVFSGPRPTPCRLGSTKAAVGHLEAASGVASLIKTVLVLRHGFIPPVPVRELNSQIRLAEGVRIPGEPSRWEEEGRVAGVDSFGYGGTNVHVVVGQARQPRKAVGPRRPEVLVLSARSEESLAELARRYTALLRERTDLCLADIAYTARTARTHHPYRLAAVGADHAEMADDLASAAGAVAGKAPDIVFEFTDARGDTDWFRALCDELPALREVVDGLDGAIDTPGFRPQYALATLLTEWGVHPDLVLGYGEGELAAACAAGALNPYDTAEVDAEAAVVPLRLGTRPPFKNGSEREITINFCADFTGDAHPRLLRLLGDLYTHGVELDWAVFDAFSDRDLVHLPSTPFEHGVRWPVVPRRTVGRPTPAARTPRAVPTPPQPSAQRARSPHPLLGRRI